MKKNSPAHKKEPLNSWGQSWPPIPRSLQAKYPPGFSKRHSPAPLLPEPRELASTVPMPWALSVCRTLFLLSLGCFLIGCLANPVERSGGPGSVTIENTNPSTILTLARRVFAERGYRTGPGQFPEHISFQRHVGRTRQESPTTSAHFTGMP
jgi:hypothetical protein